MKRVLVVLLALLTSCKGCIELDHSGQVDVYHHVDADIVISVTDAIAVDVAHDVSAKALEVLR